MRRRSERMQKVCAIAGTEEDAECRSMGKIQRGLDEDVRRLDELQAYRQSYSRQCSEPRELSSLQWKDYQKFLERLDQAIATQAQTVAEAERRCEAQRRRWLATRRKHESLERVVERYRGEESAERERKLQKASDDRARSIPLFPEPAPPR